jgi:hypothetical protein
MAVDVSGIGDCPKVESGMNQEQLLIVQQEIAEWQLLVTAFSNAIKAESDGKMAVARNFK